MQKIIQNTLHLTHLTQNIFMLAVVICYVSYKLFESYNPHYALC